MVAVARFSVYHEPEPNGDEIAAKSVVNIGLFSAWPRLAFRKIVLFSYSAALSAVLSAEALVDGTQNCGYQHLRHLRNPWAP